MTDARITFIGNATTLIECGPFRLLTEPDFLHKGQRAYLGWGLVSKRLTEPAMQPEQLPALDAVLLSHLHGDHWDRVARRALDHELRVVTTTHAARRLRGLHGFHHAIGLRSWQQETLRKSDNALTVTSLPGLHAPGPAKLLLPPVMGSMLEFGPARGDVGCRIYVSGDTLMFDGLREIPARYPRVDVALLHLGGTTLPGGLLVTMDARQGADLLELVKPSSALPIHHSDYTLFRSPLSDFRAEVDRRGLGDTVRYLEPGQTASFSVAS